MIIVHSFARQHKFHPSKQKCVSQKLIESILNKFWNWYRIFFLWSGDGNLIRFWWHRQEKYFWPTSCLTSILFVNMPAHCCCFGCKSRQQKGSGLKFFKIPKDVDLQQKWITAIKRENWMPTEHTRMCSKHFISGKANNKISLRNA